MSKDIRKHAAASQLQIGQSSARPWASYFAPDMQLPYGSCEPAARTRKLLQLCHREHGPWYARALAPLLRRYMVRHGELPVDISIDGVRMRCVFRDNYSEKKFVFTPWRYDREERQLLQHYLGQSSSPDAVFLDIGANVGIYSLTALVTPGFCGRVLAFEPNPGTRQRLLFNVAATLSARGGPPIEVLPVGIADCNSQFVLRQDNHNLGASSINAQERTPSTALQADEVLIDCRPLLEVLEEQQVRHIAALKIDIEGAEDKAMAPYLQQAPDALLARLVIIENSQHLWQQDVFELLKQRGYQRILRNRMNSVFTLDSDLQPQHKSTP